MLQNEEVIDTVIDLRRRLEAKYGWDLGEAEEGIQVDAKTAWWMQVRTREFENSLENRMFFMIRGRSMLNWPMFNMDLQECFRPIIILKFLDIRKIH